MLGREKLLESLMALSSRSAARSRPELLHTTLRGALMIAEADAVVLALSSNRQLERHVLRRGDPAPETEALRAVSDFERTLLRSGSPRPVSDLADTPRAAEAGVPGLQAGPVLFVPLATREQEPGYLAVFRRQGATRFSARDARQLAVLVAWTAVSLENIKLSETLEKLAVTDDLTQVYNYRYLKTSLRREIKRAGRYKQELSIVMVDVDNLKGYNDRNGHIRGSHLLKDIAHIFTQQVRSWDLVAKYGGDEFTIILPQTDRVGAFTAAERLRAAVEAHAFALAERGSITVSSGIATFPQDGESGATLMEAADQSLYLAKRRGRNRVEGIDRKAA
ncbi:MAG: sensor domain-containing diguanylate cyclase [Candidatus Eisenbacteria bacterium]